MEINVANVKFFVGSGFVDKKMEVKSDHRTKYSNLSN